MSLIRPEARDAILRWREVIIGAAVTATGVNWAFGGFGLMRWIGAVVLIIGLGFLVAGVQRARVRPRSGGAGVIELTERQLTFLHPEEGAIVALSLVTRIEIITTGNGSGDDMFWLFHQGDAPAIKIPASAVGAENLLDALSSFTGADYQKVIEASGSARAGRFLIWHGSVNGGIRRLH